MPEDKSPSAATQGFYNFLKEAAGASLLLSATAYAAGYFYLNAYFLGFGLRMRDLTLSSQTVMIYILPVFENGWSLLVLCFILLSSVLLSAGRRRTFHLRIKPTTAVMSAHVALSLYLIFVWLLCLQSGRAGRSNAHRDAVLTTSTLPSADVVLADEVHPVIRPFCGFSEGDTKFLMRSAEQLYFFQAIDLDQVHGKEFGVCIIPAAAVKALRLQVAFGS